MYYFENYDIQENKVKYLMELNSRLIDCLDMQLYALEIDDKRLFEVEEDIEKRIHNLVVYIYDRLSFTEKKEYHTAMALLTACKGVKV